MMVFLSISLAFFVISQSLIREKYIKSQNSPANVSTYYILK